MLRQVAMLSYKNGQALMEFVIVLPVILLILIAAYFVGSAMYAGTNASTALRAALSQPESYMDSPNPEQALRGRINEFQSGTFKAPGDVVDSVAFKNSATANTTVVSAQKQVTFPLFPPFNFTVTQALKSGLFAANTGASSGPTAMPYDVAIPKKAVGTNIATYQFQADLPLFVPIQDNCEPDLSVFDNAQVMAGCDGTCRAANTQAFFADHKALMTQVAPNACSVGTFDNDPAVTFK